MKDIPGYEGLYSVDESGNVYSHTHGRLLKQSVRKDGYMVVMLSSKFGRKTAFIHRLILLAYVGVPDESLEACHKDGNRANNRLDNLYWGTRSDNSKDRVRHGRHPSQKRETHATAKLSRQDVKDVLWLLSTKRFKQHEIAEMFGVSRQTICDINNGRSVKTVCQ